MGKKALGALRKRTNFISYSCTPGVSEITSGNLELIAVVPKFSELEKFFGNLIDSKICVSDPRCSCRNCQAAAFTMWVYKPKTFIPLCAEDNCFAAKQCHGKECFCVDKYGNELKGSRTPINKPLNCDKTRSECLFFFFLPLLLE